MPQVAGARVLERRHVKLSIVLSVLQVWLLLQPYGRRAWPVDPSLGMVTMAYEYDGVLPLKRRVTEKMVDHLAVGVGGRLGGRLGLSVWRPVVGHLLPDGLEVEPWRNGWEVLGRARDEEQALRRLVQACRRPRYWLLGNNCEHFALWVATGKRESPQVQSVAWVATGVAALVLAERRAA